MNKIEIIRHALSRYKMQAIAVGITYSLFFMFFSGMIVIIKEPIPEGFTVPSFKIITMLQNQEDIEYTFWIVAYPNRYTVISFNYIALLSMLALSLTMAIYVSVWLYQRRLSAYRCKARSSVFASIIPASFALFNCCGNGLMLILFGSYLSTLLAMQSIGGYLTNILLGGYLTLIGIAIFTIATIKAVNEINEVKVTLNNNSSS